jgi:hypothetical protein
MQPAVQWVQGASSQVFFVWGGGHNIDHSPDCLVLKIKITRSYTFTSGPRLIVDLLPFTYCFPLKAFSVETVISTQGLSGRKVGQEQHKAGH